MGTPPVWSVAVTPRDNANANANAATTVSVQAPSTHAHAHAHGMGVHSSTPPSRHEPIPGTAAAQSDVIAAEPKPSQPLSFMDSVMAVNMAKSAAATPLHLTAERSFPPTAPATTLHHAAPQQATASRPHTATTGNSCTVSNPHTATVTAATGTLHSRETSPSHVSCSTPSKDVRSAAVESPTAPTKVPLVSPRVLSNVPSHRTDTASAATDSAGWLTTAGDSERQGSSDAVQGAGAGAGSDNVGAAWKRNDMDAAHNEGDAHAEPDTVTCYNHGPEHAAVSVSETRCTPDHGQSAHSIHQNGAKIWI